MSGSERFKTATGRGLSSRGFRRHRSRFCRRVAGLGMNLLSLPAARGRLRTRHHACVTRPGRRCARRPPTWARHRGSLRCPAQARDLEIGLLVCNAASSYEGPYFKASLAKYREVIEVNCQGALALIDMAAPGMAERRRGGIIVMSSMAAFQGSPYVAVYSATKAFLLSLAEALAVEMKPRGIDVLACCPAVVRTPNYLASRPRGRGGDAGGCRAGCRGPGGAPCPRTPSRPGPRRQGPPGPFRHDAPHAAPCRRGHDGEQHARHVRRMTAPWNSRGSSSPEKLLLHPARRGP